MNGFPHADNKDGDGGTVADIKGLSQKARVSTQTLCLSPSFSLFPLPLSVNELNASAVGPCETVEGKKAEALHEGKRGGMQPRLIPVKPTCCE